MTHRRSRCFGFAAAPIFLCLGLSSADEPIGALPPTTNRYARLRYGMTSGGAIVLQEARVLESEYVADVGVLGEFVYALEGKSAVLAAGSFPDPLVVHSHLRQGAQPHAVLPATSGEFHVSLPGSVLEPGVLDSARLVFYRMEGSLPPSELTPLTLAKLRDGLRRIHVVEGADLARRLRR